MLKMIVVALGLLGGPLPFEAQDHLSDIAAGAVVNSLMNSSTGVFVYTGNVDIIREPLEAQRFQIQAQQFTDLYLLLQRIGLITFSVVPGEDDPREAGDGLPQAVNVGLTGLGHEFSVSRAPNVSLISLGNYRVKKVTENREIRNGSRLLRVVQFLFEAEWRPFVTTELMEPCAKAVSRDRKGTVLLGYDQAFHRWQLLTGDFTNETSDFCTNNVDDILRMVSK